MKKIKLLTLSLTAFIAVNLNALTLDDAVSIALKNNFEIQGKNYDYVESLENVKLNNSNWFEINKNNTQIKYELLEPIYEYRGPHPSKI